MTNQNECDRCRGVSTEHECPRCGATTPHETLAKLAGVNISQAEELVRLRAELNSACPDRVRGLTEIIFRQDAEIARLRTAIVKIARGCFGPAMIAANALKSKE